MRYYTLFDFKNRRIFVLLKWIVFSTAVKAQSPEVVANKLSIAIQLAPNNSIISISPTEKRVLSYPDKSESKFGISTGLALNIAFNQQYSILIGLGYGLKQSVFIKRGLKIAPNDYDSLTRTYVSTSQRKTYYKLHEIQLPLQLQINHSNNRLSALIGMDFIYVYNNQTERVLYYGKGGSYQIPDSKDNSTFFNYAPILGFGYNLIQKNSRTILNLSPEVRVFFKNYGLYKYDERGQLINFVLKASFYL